eukprot:scaffold74763_cov22-Tisochrysis_lutea.AAC.1
MCVYPNGGAGTEDAVVGSANRMLQGAIPTCSSLSFSSLQGFAERKLILVSEVVQACKKIHNDEIRKERLAALKTKQVGKCRVPCCFFSRPRRSLSITSITYY